MDGEVIREVQLKAVATTGPILEHLSRYPDVEILATTEVAGKIDGISSSGLSNMDLAAEVDKVLSDLPGDGLIRDVLEGAATSALLSGAIAARRVLRSGTISPAQFRSAFGDIAVGAVSATVLDALLGGVS